MGNTGSGGPNKRSRKTLVLGMAGSARTTDGRTGPTVMVPEAPPHVQPLPDVLEQPDLTAWGVVLAASALGYDGERVAWYLATGSTEKQGGVSAIDEGKLRTAMGDGTKWRECLEAFRQADLERALQVHDHVIESVRTAIALREGLEARRQT